jgi:predicted transcriptional regulator
MKIDARLEELSDKIRRGEPVGMLDAIEAIKYQEALRAERKRNTILARFVLWLRSA